MDESRTEQSRASEPSLNFSPEQVEAVTEDEEVQKFKVPVYTDSWDEYFLWIAKAVSIKSKDPRTKVGAVIVSQDKLVLSTGFNGLARGLYDDDRTLADAVEKIKIICHAEQNAILNAARMGARLEGATIYVTKFPCLACCNDIVQAGIKRLYTHDHEYWKDDPADEDHTRKPQVLHRGGIEVIAPYHPDYRPAEPIKSEKLRPKDEAKPAAEPKPGPEKMALPAKPITKMG